MKMLARRLRRFAQGARELDAILPDLVWRVGLSRVSRPASVRVAKHGVDIAGRREGRRRRAAKMFLFSVESRRSDARGMGRRRAGAAPVLNEILDVLHSPYRIPPHDRKLKIIICIVVGGNYPADRGLVSAGFIKRQSTERVSFQVWKGEHIAALLLTGPPERKAATQTIAVELSKGSRNGDEPVSATTISPGAGCATCIGVQGQGSGACCSEILHMLWVCSLAASIDNLDAHRQMYICRANKHPDTVLGHHGTVSATKSLAKWSSDIWLIGHCDCF